MAHKKTLRITYPQWQGGVNPNYVFGAELLAFIAPQSLNDKSVTVQVNKNFNVSSHMVDGIDYSDVLFSQMNETKKILEEETPERLIIFGGDCSVTQVPFEYLKRNYGSQIGILWLDAHPDISSPLTSSHLHEMPLANLLGLNADLKLTQVEHPYPATKVFLGGLIEEKLRPMDMACKDLHIRIGNPEQLSQNSDLVLEWIKEENIKFLAVHWDLDVLSPNDFRCIYPAEPYLDPATFPAAVGRMKLDEISRLLVDVSNMAEIVGLSITEHLPWDAFNMRKSLAKISIFNGQ